MSKNKTRVLLLSCALVVCILALLIGVTYALFSDKALVKNHLDAGELKITLERTKLTATRLNADGLLETKAADTSVVDFTGTTKENLFNLGSNEKTAPGCSYSAEMRISNVGDVAFIYWVEIVLGEADAELASQLTVTVTDGNKTATQKLSDGLVLGEDGGIAVVLAGKSANFTITVSFDNLKEDNSAQTQEVEFDVIVHALQKV